jgi:glycosyltransferase involved in cell wall biosynthesis
MKKLPLVSVIIPVYNGEQYIESLLDSFSNQTYGNFELLFINDGSNDETLIKLNSLKDNYTFKINVFSQVNKGVSAARNLGILKANGEYISFCDVDDYYDNRYIELMIKVIFDYDLSFAVCDLSRSLNKETPVTANHIKIFDEITFLKKFATLEIVVVHYCLLIRREFLIVNGINFAEGYKYGEDYDFAWRVIINGKNEIGYVDYPLYKYIRREGSTMSVFDDTRYDTVKVYTILEKYIEERNNDFSGYFNKYWTSRSVWSTMRLAAAKVSLNKFMRMVIQYNAKKRLENLFEFKDKRVALTSKLFCLNPKIFYYLFKIIVYRVD